MALGLNGHPVNLHTLNVHDYSQTSMASTRRDRRWEFDPSMGSSDAWADNFQESPHVLYFYYGHLVFINQNC